MYLLEGNIGVGKSTFLVQLQQLCPEIAVVEEPKDNWASFDHGQSLLANFYNDTPRWSYTLETYAMISRVREHVLEQNHTDKRRVMERSVYSGYYCFARNGYDQGFLTALEWALQQQWFDFLVTKNCLPPLGFIYLRANPTVCYQRMRMRNRMGEEGITTRYLEQIHRLHELFLIEKSEIASNLLNIPVLVLDASIDFVQNSDQMYEHAQRVRAFIAQSAVPTVATTGVQPPA